MGAAWPTLPGCFMVADGLVRTMQVAWRPPTKNSDQIERYKLMMASSTGGVREVAHGLMLRHYVTGLRPSTEYIFLSLIHI